MRKDNFIIKILIILTIVILGILAIFVVNKSNESNKSNETNKTIHLSGKFNSLDIKGQPTLGKLDAPITVVEFGDFKCPPCKLWEENIFPQLKMDYIDTGKVKFVFINVLFHGDESVVASLSAESVFKNSSLEYWDFHKKLFEAQSEGAFTTDKMIEIAKTNPKIDTVILKKDIEKQLRDKELDIDSKLVEKYNVDRTPTIFIGNTMVSDPFNYENVRKIIESELKVGN